MFLSPQRLWGPSEFFLKTQKCPILPQEGQTSIFIQKLVWCPKLAGTRVRSDSDQLQKKNGTNGCNTKLFGFAAISTIYETPF